MYATVKGKLKQGYDDMFQAHPEWQGGLDISDYVD